MQSSSATLLCLYNSPATSMMQETGLLRVRVHRTFVEAVSLVPYFPRTRSWPDIHQPGLELNVEDLDCGGRLSDEQEVPKVDLQDSEETPGNSTWSEQLGLHPEDPSSGKLPRI
eukprot:symbB.v1.2.004944.t1/scaffold285.1/size239547/18